MRAHHLSILFAIAAAPVLSTPGCLDQNYYVDARCPPFGDTGELFRPISAVLERRCGTLDCHGQSARPLRIYGQNSLRRPEVEGSPSVTNPNEYYPGGLEPTTQAELLDNYESACALELEVMARVVDKQDEPEALTLVRKPRLLEKHKGGLVWNKGDDGDACLVNWITGSDDTAPCDAELLHR